MLGKGKINLNQEKIMTPFIKFEYLGQELWHEKTIPDYNREVKIFPFRSVTLIEQSCRDAIEQSVPTSHP